MNRRKAIGSMVAGAAATAVTVGVASAADTEIEILVGALEEVEGLDAQDRRSHAGGVLRIQAVPGSPRVRRGAAAPGPGGGFLPGPARKGAAPAAPKDDITKATTVKYLTAVFDWSIGVVGTTDVGGSDQDIRPG